MPGAVKRALDVDGGPVSRQGPKKRVKTAPKAGGTCSMTKKQMCDHVKQAISLEKGNLNEALAMLSIDAAFFRAFFLDNDKLSSRVKVAPEAWDGESAVVVADVTREQAAELLGGAAKVRSGSKANKTMVGSLSVVFYPREEQAKLWVSGLRDASL